MATTRGTETVSDKQKNHLNGGPERGGLLLEQVAEDIERQIALGKILHGDRLPSERALAAQLGVSRNTVTAAYLVLEKHGAIRRVAHRGAFVSPAGPVENPIDWSSKISRQAHLLDEPVLEMLAQSRLPNLRYRLSAGTPALSCFPLAAFRKATDKVLANEALLPSPLRPRKVNRVCDGPSPHSRAQNQAISWSWPAHRRALTCWRAV